MDSTSMAGQDAGKVLDTLAAISMQLSCHQTCDAIDAAVTSLDNILTIVANERGGSIS